MKRIFFIILLVIGGFLQVFSQQEHPVATSIKTGEVLYLYNRNMSGFLVGGNNYNTQASLSSGHAFKVVLEKYLNESGKWDGITYFITDSVEMGNFRGMYRKLFIENNGLLYVDQDEQSYTSGRDNLWTIEQIEGKENIYKITPSPLNRNHDFRGKQLGVMPISAQSLPVVGLYDPIANIRDYEWCFVTGKDKDLYFERQQIKRKVAKESIIKRSATRTKNIPDEQVVYMLNNDYDGYLIGGNRYNTQASLSKTDAHKVILHKYIEQGKEWDGKSYIITDSVRSGSYAGKYRNVFIGPDGIIWTDQREDNSYMDCIWEIESSKSNPSSYYITPSDKNNVFRSEFLPDYYLGAVIQTNFRELPTIELVKGKEGKHRTWSFVTEEQWKRIETIERREELQKYINIVKNWYPDYDIARAQQICNDYDYSVSEVENQIGQMRLVLFSNGGNSTSGVDFTRLIKNADFEGTGGIGWNMPFDVNVGSITWYGGDNLNHCAEAYQSIFEFYQEIKGIPNGLYRVDLQAFYRTRGADLAWIERDTSYVVPEFYANSMSMPINNLMHTTFPADNGEYDFLQADMLNSQHNWSEPKILCLDGTYALNNMRATALAFSKGYYNQSLYCFVNDGMVKLGIKENQMRTGSWAAWDNFRLTYLAETTENYKEAVRCYMEKAKEIERLTRVKKVESQNLIEAIEHAEQALQSDNKELLGECLVAINNVMERTRDFLEVYEFGESEKNKILLYSQVIEENDTEEERQNRENRNAKQRSNRRILDEANSYIYIGNLVKDQNEELALKHLNNAFNSFVKVPSSYSENNIEGCANELSKIYQDRRQYDDAIGVWTKLADSRSESRWIIDIEMIANAYCEIGHIFAYKKTEYGNAENAYRKAANTIEELYDYFRNSNNEDKLKKYQVLLANYLNALSYSLAYQKKYEDALLFIEKAIALQPEDPNYYDSKGEILYLSGDKKGAGTMWDKVITLDPKFDTKYESQLYKLLFGK